MQTEGDQESDLPETVAEQVAERPHIAQPLSGTFIQGNETQSLLVSGSSDNTTPPLPSHSQSIVATSGTILPQILDSFGDVASENIPASYQSVSSHDDENEQANTNDNQGQDIENLSVAPQSTLYGNPLGDECSDNSHVNSENHAHSELQSQTLGTASIHPFSQGTTGQVERLPVLQVEENHAHEQTDISLSGTNNPNAEIFFNIACCDVVPIWQAMPSPYLEESNLAIGEIVRLWEMPDEYNRLRLLDFMIRSSEYRPNVVQRGGIVALLRTLDSLNGCINDYLQTLRTETEGVLLNSQDQLSPVSGYFQLGNEYFESVPAGRFSERTYLCHLAEDENSQFVTKEFTQKEWQKEQMLILLMIKNSIMVKPQGITWDYHGIRLFFPFQKGQTLTEILRIHGHLTIEEVYLLTFELIQFLSELNKAHVMHRNIHPDHLIICQPTRSFHMVGLSAICSDRSRMSWVPSNLNFHCAPELARGEEHDIKSEMYSVGAMMLSALTGNIPYFDTRGMQRTRQNYIYMIASGNYSTTGILRSMTFNRLIEILINMTELDVSQRYTPEQLLSSYFQNEVNFPRWSNDSFFGPRSEISFEGCPWREVLQTQGVNILGGDDFSLDQTNVVTASRRSDTPPVDSGHLSSRESDDYLIVIEENGQEVTWFELPRTSFGRDVYQKLKKLMNLTGAFTLKYAESNNLRFEVPLIIFHDREIHLILDRNLSEINNLSDPVTNGVQALRGQALSDGASVYSNQEANSGENISKSHSLTSTDYGRLNPSRSGRDFECLPVNTGRREWVEDSTRQSSGQGVTDRGIHTVRDAQVEANQVSLTAPIHHGRQRTRSIGACSVDDDADVEENDDEISRERDESSLNENNVQFQFSEDMTENRNAEEENDRFSDEHVFHNDDGRLSTSVNVMVSDEDTSNDVAQDTDWSEQRDLSRQRHMSENFEEETDEELFSPSEDGDLAEEDDNEEQDGPVVDSEGDQE